MEERNEYDELVSLVKDFNNSFNSFDLILKEDKNGGAIDKRKQRSYKNNGVCTVLHPRK